MPLTFSYKRQKKIFKEVVKVILKNLDFQADHFASFIRKIYLLWL